MTDSTKTTILISLLACGSAAAQPAAPAPDWKTWSALVGEWVADPSGPGGPTGGFTLAPELEGRVLVRRNRADYPATKERPAATHEDLMVVHQDGGATRADYYDSEGHVIRYAVTVENGRRFVFLSDPEKGQPRFRLTYVVGDGGALALSFDIAPPGAAEVFRPYIQATAHRKR